MIKDYGRIEESQKWWLCSFEMANQRHQKLDQSWNCFTFEGSGDSTFSLVKEFSLLDSEMTFWKRLVLKDRLKKN